MHFDYQGGWLGPDEEKRAWETVRRMDANTRGVVGDCPLYHEFSERVTAIRERKTAYANRPFTWDISRKLFKTGRMSSELIPTFLQDTGNCVGAGLRGAIYAREVIEVGLFGEEEKVRDPYTPFIYAVSRNQIGGGMSGAGSTGVWGARAVNEYGTLFCDDEGVPAVEGYSDKWGSRSNVRNPEYAKFFDVAKDNKIEMVRATSVEQMAELMDAGYILTIASYQGFKVVEYKGLHVYRPSGSWSHQMHFTDMRRDPELMFYRMNQWGADHTTPLNGETPGGAWNLASDLDDEINSQVEIYGFQNFQGDPGDPNYHFI